MRRIIPLLVLSTCLAAGALHWKRETDRPPTDRAPAPPFEWDTALRTAIAKERAALGEFRKEQQLLSMHGGSTNQDLLIRDFQWREARQERVKLEQETLSRLWASWFGK